MVVLRIQRKDKAILIPGLCRVRGQNCPNNCTDRRKNEFLALLAHELRNPLTPIRSAVQLMQFTDDPEANKTATGIVERQVDQMVRLVDDLLDVSRISRGTIELR